MKRQDALVYARSLVEHPDTDAGVRELAAAYIELSNLVDEQLTEAMLLEPSAHTEGDP